MIEIDGLNLKEGGQVLRTAFALSAITKKDCHFFNIRSNEASPGLTSKQLAGLKSLTQICNAKMEGDMLGSKEISFSPDRPIEGQSSFHIKSEIANSITLFLQSLILPIIFFSKPLKIIFEGGATDTFFSPTIDYFSQVFLKTLEKMGIKAEINIIKRGYYPEGGASVEATIFPSKLKNLNLINRGNLKIIKAISGASESLKEKKIAERQMAGVREVLGKLKLPIEEKIEYYQTLCPGSQICLIAEFENTIIGTDNLGRLGKRAEELGKEAALELLKESKTNTCIDKHLTDQILPFIALSEGKSRFSASEITENSKKIIQIIEKFLNGKFEIKESIISWNPNLAG
ncbi:MAG: RNA 3'-terminal phosphate cyclase [Candidatus Nealsonbacteria bacterium]|nr:RNA 3'-terminal phosphate cyclase [Candidatus Nealsonbacteria bacterium]